MKIINSNNNNGINPLPGGAADVNIFGTRKPFINFGGSRFGGKAALSPQRRHRKLARKQ